MTKHLGVRAAAVSARAATHLVVFAIAAVLALAGGASVGADQTVYFDEAGSAPHISLLGDSTLTGVRWYSDYGELERYNFVFSAESCRRTIEQSCIGREGYRSKNVVAAMQTLDGDLGDVLVIMSGYNDPIWTIDEAIEGVVEEARRQDVDHVVWLTLRTSDGVDYSDPQHQSSINTFRKYNEQLVDAASASDGFLQVADWATYSNGASAWFEADGVHLTARGVDAVTSFIAAIVDRVFAGEDVSPASAPWTVLVPGAEGEVVAAVQDALASAGVAVAGGADGVYGNQTMAAVAEFQRAQADLQVTGAVDMATARALGVYIDPEVAEAAATLAPTSTAAPTTTITTRATTARTPATTGARAVPLAADSANGAGGVPARWVLVAVGAATLAIAAAGAVRVRHVTAGRTARRWARVHPATSPRRSVADMRRTGELPAVPPEPSRPVVIVYDHELEVAEGSVGD